MMHILATDIGQVASTIADTPAPVQQTYSFIFLGVLTLAVIFFVVHKITDELKNRMDKLEEKLADLTNLLMEISGKLWSPAALENQIKATCNDMLREHTSACPVCKRYSQGE